MPDEAIIRTVKANRRQATPAERRTYPRHAFTATVEAYDPATKLRVKGRTSDLSRGGCYVDTISPFGLGTCAKVRITKDSKTFDTEARVVYMQASMGMGMMFSDLLPPQVEVIDRWIGEATGEIAESSGGDFVVGAGNSGEAAAASKLKEEQQYVLNDLVIALMHKGILEEAEGKAMLARLHR